MEEQGNTIAEELQKIRENMNPKKGIGIKILNGISLVLSIAAFFLALFPQINPLNSNYVERAEAGDVEAQMFLAEHYFEVGENKDSHYWYKIASMYFGDHQAAALNNVAYIGLTYGYYNDSLMDYQNKALNMFKKAAALGDKAAVQNMYTLLKELGKENAAVDYEQELAWVIQVSYHFGIQIGELSETEIKWALEQFHLSEYTAYATDMGWVYYNEIGIYPKEDAFAQTAENYDSYLYSIESNTENRRKE